MHRKHENKKGEFWRLCKIESKLGKLLMEAKMCRSGGLALAEILAVFFGENRAAACARIGIGAQRGSGRVFKGANRAEQGTRERLHVRPVGFDGVLLGHEVGDGSDGWVALVGETGRGPALSTTAVKRRGARLAGRFGSGPGKRLGRAVEREGGEKSWSWGEKLG